MHPGGLDYWTVRRQRGSGEVTNKLDVGSIIMTIHARCRCPLLDLVQVKRHGSPRHESPLHSPPQRCMGENPPK